MNATLKSFAIPFVSGIAGAALWMSVQTPEFNNSSPVIPESTQIPSQITSQPRTSPLRTDPPLSFIEASQNSTESVVFIKNFSGTDYRRYSMFDYFFGTGPTQQVSTGSGVIISKDGYIITNNHVIDRAETIEVVHQKRTYKAKLVGTDKNTDIAVLKIEAENLPEIKRGSSRNLQIGEWVWLSETLST